MSEERDRLRAFCAGHDVACPWCGYNLRDQPFAGDDEDSDEGLVCPECGKHLRALGETLWREEGWDDASPQDYEGFRRADVVLTWVILALALAALSAVGIAALVY